MRKFIDELGNTAEFEDRITDTDIRARLSLFGGNWKEVKTQCPKRKFM